MNYIAVRLLYFLRSKPARVYEFVSCYLTNLYTRAGFDLRKYNKRTAMQFISTEIYFLFNLILT